jgi:hypothetical protein
MAEKMITRTKRINHVHVYTVEMKDNKPQPVDQGIVDITGTYHKESGIRRAVIAATSIADPVIGEVVPEDQIFEMPESQFFAQAKPRLADQVTTK